MGSPNVLWLEDVDTSNIPDVGGKNASLGELIRSMAEEGIRVPGGFATTAAAFRRYVDVNALADRVREVQNEYHNGRLSLRDAGSSMRAAILSGEFPTDIAEEIRLAYGELARRAGSPEPAVAVRSSATAEDLPDASFAGQQETFLNVRGEQAVLDACRRCYASLFTDRAISYRELTGYSELEVSLSVGVQLMVRSDVGSSGVMFSLDPETGFPRVAVISANWGLGETVVQGSVNPDKYMVFKPLLVRGTYAPVIEKTKGSKLRNSSTRRTKPREPP